MDPRSLASFTDVLKITMSASLKLTNVKMQGLQLALNNDLVGRTKWSVNITKLPVKLLYSL